MKQTISIASAIRDLLSRADYRPCRFDELMRRLRCAESRESEFRAALAELEQAGEVTRTKGDRYVPARDADLIPGRIRMNRQGKGFLQPDDPALREIAVPESATGTALHEDRVLVRLDVPPLGLRPEPRDPAGAPATGTVVRILERRRTRLVGTLQASRQFLYVVPDDPRITHDFYVTTPPRDLGRAPQPGDKVVVELRDWPSRHLNPEGEIVELLGAPDAEGVDLLSILRNYDLPLSFPDDVLQEARAHGTEIRADDLAGRVDCRDHRVVTIDPDDAKDFDDAICLERAGTDRWRLWVHIADVSHYVKPGTALDTEARRRGNSTYLVDRVIPMLPEALSNELCSLKPDVERLTKCVEFLLSSGGEVLSTKLYPAVIRSQRRFTYGEALAVLQRPPDSPVAAMLHHANDLAQRLRKDRFRQGSLELDFPELKIRLDERGRVARIERIENDISHQLIEEFMLLANQAVAAHLMRRGQPAVHRIHEPPDARRLNEFRQDVLAHGVPCGNLTQRAEVQRLLHRLAEHPIGPALRIGFLRSLMRARYSIQPLGHYGLAKKEYTHFTSPIRRYADLLVHRAAFEPQPSSLGDLQRAAEHISLTERTSADAERDSKDVKLFAFLEAQLASRPVAYAGLVTEVRNFGFFVDVTDLGLSGLVPLSGIEDDFYVYDPARNQLVGRRTRRIIRLGDSLRVQVAKVDRFKKQVDFRLASTRAPSPRTAGTGAPRGRGAQRPDTSRTARPEARRVPASRRPAAPPPATSDRPFRGARPSVRRPFEREEAPRAARPVAPRGARPDSRRDSSTRPTTRPPAASRPRSMTADTPERRPRDRRAAERVERFGFDGPRSPRRDAPPRASYEPGPEQRSRPRSSRDSGSARGFSPRNTDSGTPARGQRRPEYPPSAPSTRRPAGQDWRPAARREEGRRDEGRREERPRFQERRESMAPRSEPRRQDVRGPRPAPVSDRSAPRDRQGPPPRGPRRETSSRRPDRGPRFARSR